MNTNRQLCYNNQYPLCFILVFFILSGAARTSAQEINPDALAIHYKSSKGWLERGIDGSYPCGDDSSTPLPSRPIFSWENDFLALTRLGNHYMPDFALDGDSMTEPLGLLGADPAPFGSEGIRETWYISRDNLAGTAPLFRFYSLPLLDHLDSPNANAGASIGYIQELIHGYPWTGQRTGMTPLTRYLNTNIFDHTLYVSGAAPQAYVTDVEWGDNSSLKAFGYQRYGNLLEACHVVNSQYMDTLSNPVFEVKFNRIWGHAIGSITHLPTGQELVRDGIGEMVQSTLFAGSGTDLPGNCCNYNPTQSGGIDIYNGSNTKRWVGSPILANFQQLEDGLPQQISEVRPVNWKYTAWQGNSGWEPLLWRGTFNKVITLGQILEGIQYDDVFKMSFQAKIDEDAPAEMLRSPSMNNVFWLTMNPIGDGNVDNFPIELLDVATGNLEDLGHPPERFNDRIIIQDPVNKAIIFSRTDLQYAMGFYSTTDLDHYAFWFWCDGVLPDPTTNTCPNVFQAFFVNTFAQVTLEDHYSKADDIYLAIGTRSEVIARLQQIYTKIKSPQLFADSFESGDTIAWSLPER